MPWSMPGRGAGRQLSDAGPFSRRRDAVETRLPRPSLLSGTGCGGAGGQAQRQGEGLKSRVGQGDAGGLVSDLEAASKPDSTACGGGGSATLSDVMSSSVAPEQTNLPLDLGQPAVAWRRRFVGISRGGGIKPLPGGQRNVRGTTGRRPDAIVAAGTARGTASPKNLRALKGQSRILNAATTGLDGYALTGLGRPGGTALRGRCPRLRRLAPFGRERTCQHRERRPQHFW